MGRERPAAGRYIAASDKLLAERQEKDRESWSCATWPSGRPCMPAAVNAADYRTALAVLRDEAELLTLYGGADSSEAAAGGVAVKGTADVVKLLAGLLAQIDASGLPVAEKSKLTATLADAMLCAFSVDVLDSAWRRYRLCWRAERRKSGERPPEFFHTQKRGADAPTGRRGRGTMNSHSLARNYAQSTPEERFRHLAAHGRDDEADRDRLAKSAGRIGLTVTDHLPYYEAFTELATLIFTELVEEAAHYQDALRRTGDADELDAIETEAEEGDQAEQEQGDEVEEKPASTADTEPAEGDDTPSISECLWDLALATGFFLRRKVDGWKLFCERLNVPPFVLWKDHPGFDRLMRSLDLAERAAFVPEGMVRWLNRIRPAGEPELTEAPFGVEWIADATERLFRKQAEWWGGE